MYLLMSFFVFTDLLNFVQLFDMTGEGVKTCFVMCVCLCVCVCVCLSTAGCYCIVTSST